MDVLVLQRNNIPQSAAMAMLDALSNNRDDWSLSSINLEGNRGVPTILQDAFRSLPKLKPNRYGIMSGVDRMKSFKTVRDVLQQAQKIADKRKEEMAKSPLRPPSKRPISPLGSSYRPGRGGGGGSKKIGSDDDSDGYDEGAHMDIYADSDDDDQMAAAVVSSPSSRTSSSSAADAAKESKSSKADASPGFTIDIDAIQFPAPGANSPASSSKPSSKANTGRSSRVEHGDRSPPKAAEQDYDSDDSDNLSPRTVELMRAAYADMMSGGNRMADLEVQAATAGAGAAVTGIAEGKEGGGGSSGYQISAADHGGVE